MRQKWEDGEFETCLGYIVRLSQKKKKKIKGKKKLSTLYSSQVSTLSQKKREINQVEPL
jgi:hypothetical protein